MSLESLIVRPFNHTIAVKARLPAQLLALLIASLLPAPAAAQQAGKDNEQTQASEPDAETSQDETAQQEPSESSGGGDSEAKNFVPSEEIKADTEVTFPADI